MNTLLVIFDTDLIPLQTQKDVINYIKHRVSWARLTPGAWLVRTAKTTELLRNELITNYSISRVIVFNITDDNWGTSFTDDVSNWMKENI